jgi:hypothetical protein
LRLHVSAFKQPTPTTRSTTRRTPEPGSARHAAGRMLRPGGSSTVRHVRTAHEIPSFSMVHRFFAEENSSRKEVDRRWHGCTITSLRDCEEENL